MNSTLAGWLQFLLLFAALAACYIPLGNYIAHVFTDKKHWRVERGIYKLTGIDPDADMRWTVYVRSILAFSLVAVLFVYLIERTQHWLFWSIGMANVPTDTAWNTAVSFTTNTNWQNYAGEATMGYLTQQGGLMVQQFFSAAVGLAVAIAMIRGFTRSRTDRLGNFWVDVTRGIIRLLIPIAVSFHISVAAVTAVASLYYLAYGLLPPAYGLLADRFGRVRVIRAALLGTAAADVLSALSPNLTALLVARFITGGIACGVMPTTLVYLGDRFPFTVRQQAITNVLVFVALGTAAGTLGAGLTAHVLTWRVFFLVPGAIALGVAIALRCFPESPVTRSN